MDFNKLIICPACLMKMSKSHRHHCHLRDAALAFARVILWKKFGPERSANVPSRWQWPDDRIRSVWRFEPVNICPQCNAIDACDLDSRPGPYFSLSPSEMQNVRQAVGNRANQGDVFRRELREVRRKATPDYLSRLQKASVFGVDLALEWIAKETSRTCIT